MLEFFRYFAADLTYAFLFFAVPYTASRVLLLTVRGVRRSLHHHHPHLMARLEPPWRLPEPIAAWLLVAVLLAPAFVLLGPTLAVALDHYSTAALAFAADGINEVGLFAGFSLLALALGSGVVLGTAHGLQDPLPRAMDSS